MSVVAFKPFFGMFCWTFKSRNFTILYVPNHLSHAGVCNAVAVFGLCLQYAFSSISIFRICLDTISTYIIQRPRGNRLNLFWDCYLVVICLIISFNCEYSHIVTMRLSWFFCVLCIDVMSQLFSADF